MIALMTWLVGLLLAAVTQPGSTVGTRTVSVEEREALIALYGAMGGPTWIHRDGWLGPPGSECRWYGVLCADEDSGPAVGTFIVADVELRKNGLTGRVPPEVGALKGLRRLMLAGNAVRAPLPDVLLQRWDEGLLEVEPLSLLHDVEEVFVDFNNLSVLCSGYQATMAAGGSIRLVRRLCRERPGKTTELYCEYQEGRTYEFDILGRFLVRSGFFGPRKPRLRHNIAQDVGEMTVTAKRGGRSYLLYSQMDPDSIANWSLSVILEGIVARAHDWTSPGKETPCPSE